MKCLVLLLMAFSIYGCKEKNTTKRTLPSTAYNYVQIDTALLSEKRAVYAPVYSHIHFESGETSIQLAATLSIRNVAYSGSFYITDVLYYDSQGKLLKKYISTPILVHPMQSVEFVVERSKTEGGAGANFMVRWGAKDSLRNRPLIQTVMIEGGPGISFVANSVEINP